MIMSSSSSSTDLEHLPMYKVQQEIQKYKSDFQHYVRKYYMTDPDIDHVWAGAVQLSEHKSWAPFGRVTQENIHYVKRLMSRALPRIFQYQKHVTWSDDVPPDVMESGSATRYQRHPTRRQFAHGVVPQTRKSLKTQAMCRKFTTLEQLKTYWINHLTKFDTRILRDLEDISELQFERDVILFAPYNMLEPEQRQRLREIRRRVEGVQRNVLRNRYMLQFISDQVVGCAAIKNWKSPTLEMITTTTTTK